jgi:hypothetical protein
VIATGDNIMKKLVTKNYLFILMITIASKIMIIGEPLLILLLSIYINNKYGRYVIYFLILILILPLSLVIKITLFISLFNFTKQCVLLVSYKCNVMMVFNTSLFIYLMLVKIIEKLDFTYYQFINIVFSILLLNFIYLIVAIFKNWFKYAILLAQSNNFR